MSVSVAVLLMFHRTRGASILWYIDLHQHDEEKNSWSLFCISGFYKTNFMYLEKINKNWSHSSALSHFSNSVSSLSVALPALGVENCLLKGSHPPSRLAWYHVGPMANARSHVWTRLLWQREERKRLNKWFGGTCSLISRRNFRYALALNLSSWSCKTKKWNVFWASSVLQLCRCFYRREEKRGNYI